MQSKDRDIDPPLILIVDDDNSMRDSMTRLIRSFGFRATAYASADDFIESSEVQKGACLILDVRMPGMDGLQLQRHLAEAQCDIPVIFITAQASEEERKQATHAGSVAFLSKPASEETLLSAVQGALRQQGWSNEPTTQRSSQS